MNLTENCSLWRQSAAKQHPGAGRLLEWAAGRLGAAGVGDCRSSNVFI